MLTQTCSLHVCGSNEDSSDDAVQLECDIDIFWIKFNCGFGKNVIKSHTNHDSIGWMPISHNDSKRQNKWNEAETEIERKSERVKDTAARSKALHELVLLAMCV